MNKIQEQFNLIAKEYDANRRKFIPCYDDFYDGTTAFIAANIKDAKRIVDLGAGTGLLTSYWYSRFPQAEYILVDIASEMLDIARKRFAGLDNVSFGIENYIDKLPDASFDTVISALSIHHLEDGDKSALFAKIYHDLPNGGVFVNYDQFCAGDGELDGWYDSYWEGQLYDSGLAARDIELWKERRKLDRECSVEREIGMLSSCGFKSVKCVYSYHKFAVIVAIK